MVNTLIGKLTVMEQYERSSDKGHGTIKWKSGDFAVYDGVKVDDNAIFITARQDDKLHQVLIGRVSSKEEESLIIENVSEYSISLQDVMRLDSFYPEFIPSVSTRFLTQLHKKELDIELIKKQIRDRIFIDYYILRNESELSNLLHILKPNDRVAVMKDGVFDRLTVFRSDQLKDFDNQLFFACKYSLEEMIIINNNLKKSTNIRRLDTIKKHLDNNPYYKFNNFIGYQTTLLNKLVYGDGKTKTIAPTQSTKSNDQVSINPQPLNLILYGPPGTGKTYNSINRAVAIADQNFVTGGDEHNSRENITNRYRELVKDGRIVFTTFHQSMSYEDFIEGIKPLKPDEDKQLGYAVEDGVFKRICTDASLIVHSNTSFDWGNALYYKMSLGGKGRLDIHEWCLDNDVICIGWGGENDLSDFSKIEKFDEYKERFLNKYPDLMKESEFNARAAYTFQRMKEGDVVVVSKGNQVIDAIGIVAGPYYWSNNPEIDYYHYRKVQWIAKYLDSPIDRYLDKRVSQMSIYSLNKNQVNLKAFQRFNSSNKQQPYVLIIDEINRGNVSQIFGELITLVEKDKRTGESEALEVTLPYSSKQFSVPPNLYIIGTMNTADRSVEALDTALRRRFIFEEILPLAEIIDDNGTDLMGKELCTYRLKDILATLNKRIKILLDRDHQIGHSYFLGLKSDEELMDTFNRKLIPLLQEYFYGDYAKIGLVLGDGFVINEALDENMLSSFNYADPDSLVKESFQLMKFENVQDFQIALDTMMKNRK